MTTKKVVGGKAMQPDALAKKLAAIHDKAYQSSIKYCEADDATQSQLNKQLHEIISAGVAKLTPSERTQTAERFIHQRLLATLRGERVEDLRKVLEAFKAIMDTL